MPDDLLDPIEPKLARRVRAFSDQAVQPVDAAAVSRAVIGARRPRFGGRFGRGAGLAWVAAVGVILAAVAVPTLLAPGRGNPPAPTGPAIVETAVTGIPECGEDDVDAVLVAWDGAAGSRIATVELRNVVGRTCTMWSVAQPILTAMGTPLIVGAEGSPAPGTIEVGPSDVLTTAVRASNYCGTQPTRDQLPVTIQVVQARGVYTATPLEGSGADGVPPCNGAAEPASIEMQPWALKPRQ